MGRRSLLLTPAAMLITSCGPPPPAVVDLTVGQQLSNFVTTQTGVNNSPTLTKREVRTSLSVADGDIVIIGGLAENRSKRGRWERSDV